MEANEEIRTLTLILIHEGLTSCDDRIIHALEEIEKQVKMKDAVTALTSGSDPEGNAFKTLARGYFMLERVCMAANAIKQNLSFVDEIELFLAFQIRLKDKLGLPTETQDMIFRGCANVTDEQMDEAGNYILAEYKRNPGAFETYLSQMPIWQQHLRRQEVRDYRYETLPPATISEQGDVNLKEAICPITQYSPKQPVLYNGILYEYGMLKQQYIDNGWDINRQPIQWAEVKRIDRPDDRRLLL